MLILGAQVVICEMDSAYSNVRRLVAARSSRSAEEREDFLRESRSLVALRHPALAAILGVCTAEGSADEETSPAPPYCALFEYSPLGDLWHYLREEKGKRGGVSNASSGDSSPPSAAGGADGEETREGDCCPSSSAGPLHMAAQAASALAYLEENSVVHKDVAARWALSPKCMATLTTKSSLPF